MKRISLIALGAGFLFAASACDTGNSTKEGKDSVRNNYDTETKVDTSKVTTETGDASQVDKSGNGGVEGKDTTKTGPHNAPKP